MTVAVVDDDILRWAGLVIDLAILAALFCYRLLYRRASPLVSYWGGIALAFCLAPLITNVTERYHFILLLPAYIYVTYLWICVRLDSRLFYALLIATFALTTLTLRIYVGYYMGMVFWALGAPSFGALTLAAAIFYAAHRLRNRDLGSVAVN